MNKPMQFRKYRKFAAISIILAFLLPALVTATVVISYTYPTSTSSTSPLIYLAQGPNYATANSMGLFTATNTTSNGIISGTTITINNVSGSQTTYLLNVLEIYNKTGLKVPTTITFSSISLPSGVTMYYSTSPMTYSSQGTEVPSGGTTVSLTTAGVALYLSFELTAPVTTSSGLFNFYYTVG
ncbi:MAG: hypothetical protein QW258_01175 [Thermoplasmata archaeon]